MALGTSRDSPALGGVYRHRNHEMTGDLIAALDEQPSGSPLLHPVMRSGTRIHPETLSELRARAAVQLEALPERLRLPRPASEPEPYPVAYSERLRELGTIPRLADHRHERGP
jgi:nicotinate phosphoribosyltransferase